MYGKVILMGLLALAFLLPTHGGTGSGLLYPQELLEPMRVMAGEKQFEFDMGKGVREFYGIPQTSAHLVRFEGEPELLYEIQTAMKEGRSFDWIHTRYGGAIQILERDMPGILWKEAREGREFVCHFLGSWGAFQLELDQAGLDSLNVVGQWSLSSPVENRLEAAWFISSFKAQPLPRLYGDMVAYARWMVPSGIQIHTGSLGEPGVDSLEFEALISFPGRPEEDAPVEELKAWKKKRNTHIEEQARAHPRFEELLRAAMFSKQSSLGYREFEVLAKVYLTPEDVLRYQRLRRPMKGCGTAPFNFHHRRVIAGLAAEVGHFELFLKTHTVLASESIPRSVKLEGRQSLVHELEALEIRVVDLLLGLSMLVQSKDPFTGLSSFSKMFAELEDRDYFETRVLTAVEDEELDIFNRFWMMANYVKYLENLQNKEESARKMEDFKLRLQSLPPIFEKFLKEVGS